MKISFINREHEIQKGGPQIMTSWYDDVVPGMLPIFEDGGDDACVNTRVVPSSAAQTLYEREKSDGHTMFSSVLNPKFRWSIGDGRAHR